ncbi:MAG: ribose-phosphate diphosphokinase [Candidatus Wallbacteria bacterium]|nr:ribose-phosphate diphosphokinase [Candidatus Wallbacteria bacterium]
MLNPSPSLFISQETYSQIREKKLKGPNGWLLFYATESGFRRAQRVVDIYNDRLSQCSDAGKQVELIHKREDGTPVIKGYDDTETNPRLPNHVAGANVFVFSDPHSRVSGKSVNDEIYRTLQLVYTLKVHGAHEVNLVMPYLPYSRAERSSYLKREAAQSELFAKLLDTAGVNRVITYHLHSDAIKAFFQPKRVVGLSGMDFFIELLSRFKGDLQSVVISTDAGGAKQTYLLAQNLNLDYAVSSKYRSTSKETTENLGIIGNLEGKRVALITDDETVTFGSFLNAIKNLKARHDVQEIYAAVSHFKLMPKYLNNLIECTKFGLKKLYVTDTIPQIPELLNQTFIEQKSLDDLLVFVINRLHYDQSVSALIKLDEK